MLLCLEILSSSFPFVFILHFATPANSVVISKPMVTRKRFILTPMMGFALGTNLTPLNAPTQAQILAIVMPAMPQHTQVD